MDNSNLSILESSYNKYIQNLNKWLPEGIVNVDLPLLNDFGLLNKDNTKNKDNESLTRYFHVVESEEKITLYNDQFVVWIVPENINNVPTTYTLIAINDHHQPFLEVAFATAGVYNTSRMVLRILEKFLAEIQENEDLVKKYKAEK